MIKYEETDAVRAQVKTLQIIVAALASGVVFFVVLVTTVLRPGGGANVGPMIAGLPLLTAMSIAFGLASVVASLLVPRVIVEGGLRAIAKGPSLDDMKQLDSGERQVYPSSDVGRLLPLYLTQLIIASSLNEGGAFFGAIAYLLEGRPIALAVTAALVALILTRFPTLDGVQLWLESQLERLASLRRGEFSAGP